MQEKIHAILILAAHSPSESKGSSAYNTFLLFFSYSLSERCQHVAALLFAVLHVQTPSSTSLPCKWLAPSQGRGNYLHREVVQLPSQLSLCCRVKCDVVVAWRSIMFKMGRLFVSLWV